MKIEININQKVKVNLTEYGKEKLNQYFEENNIKRFATDVYETQLWNLMQIFGDEMFNGSKQCFENNIIEL